MSKKVLIEISLVEEFIEKSNQEIVDEIFKEITEGTTIIPWCKKVNKVVVLESLSSFNR